MIRASLKSLLARRVRLLLSTFAIVLGVAFVTGILMFSDTLQRSFTALFASTVGDSVVQVEGSDLGGENGPVISTQTVPASVEPALEQLPGAARVDGMVSATGVYVLSTENKVVGGSGPPAFGGNWSDAPAGHGLEGLVILQGHEPHGSDEVVLDENTADRAGYELGDQVAIVTATQTLDVHPTLVGIAGFREGGSLNGATYAAFDTPTAQQLFLDGQDAYNTFWITAKDGVSQEELTDQANAALPDGYEAITGDDAAEERAGPLLSGIDFLTTFLLIFAGIALVVSSYIIVNTFSILVAQRSRELALLRALGASKRQVIRSVQLEAFVVGVVGSTLGLGLGYVLALGIRSLVATFGLDLADQPLILAPRTPVAAYATGIIVTMVAAWLPARRTGRIAPVQALRDDVALPESSVRRRLLLGIALIALGIPLAVIGLFVGAVPHNGWWVGAGVLAVLLGVTAASPVIGRPFLRATGAADAKLFGPIGQLAGQNSLRNPRRTTATASALMIGLTLAFTVAILGSSAKASVDAQVEDNFIGDFIVSSAFGEGYSPAITDRMADIDGVDSVLRERFGYGLHGGDPTYVVATAPETISDFDMTMDSGRATDLADGTVLVEKDWASENHVTTGDTYEITVPTGKHAVADRRRLRGDPADLLAGPHHHPDPDRLRLPRPGQLRGDLRRGRPGRGRAPGAAGRRGEGPAGRDGEGRAGVRRRAARPDRPDHRGHLRAAGVRGADRHPRHREHPRPLRDRAHPRDRAAARDRGQPPAAAADDPARVGGDRRPRGRARGGAGHRVRGHPDVRPARPGAGADQHPGRAAGGVPGALAGDRGARGGVPRPACGPP